MTSHDVAARYVEAFHRALASCLATRYPGEDIVAQSVRYAMSAGGKRVRPTLCLMAAEAVGGDLSRGIAGALAIEFVHTYSLVHDDLPCMDDDDLRRGRPTTHKVFGEAQGLLAGDALLTDAFAILTDERLDIDGAQAVKPQTRLSMVRELAEAAGGAGMVKGQSLDLYWTARPGARHAELDEIHLRKTGYLLGAAVAIGALAAEADPDAVRRFREFGRHVGLAFQILDDVLDETEGTGKTQGKDKATGKLTYLALMSRDEARRIAAEHTDQALALLTATGAKVEIMRQFARGLLDRRS